MPTVPTAVSGTSRPYTKTAGLEPLPGYKLLAPLGSGGFGEVWKCEAPGGLHKAIKFVTSDSDDGRGRERFGQELAAFEQIKAIRHPFLLTLERVEQVDGELVMVMELADRQLQDRFTECQTCGLPGIPREELLAYFADAAEALDVISAKYYLQHLDIKPANLFLVSGHVKVGDYGLVAHLEGTEASNRGLTPRYVSPEVLHGAASNRSDQYSLALVYHELLTGGFPYPGRTPQQLMLQHVSGTPNLEALPKADRPAVARALAKKPEERFPSCLAFVQALMASGADTALPAAGLSVRRARMNHSVGEMKKPTGDDYPGSEPSVSDRHDSTHPGPERPRGQEPTETYTLSTGSPHTVSGPAVPPLITGNRRPQDQRPRPSRDSLILTPPPSMVETPSPSEEDEVEAGLVILERIRSVVSVSTLLGVPSNEPLLGIQAFAAAVLQTAANGAQIPQFTGDVIRLPDGTWTCSFPSTVPDAVVPWKLVVVGERWGVSVEQPESNQVVLRRTVKAGGFFKSKTHGYEVIVSLPPGDLPLREVTVFSRLFGTPDAKFTREMLDILPKVMASVREQLANAPDRRKHPRVACELPVALYPIHSDGSVDAVIPATCHDVSLGGLGLIATMKLRTKYVFAAFPDVTATLGQAALLRIVRVTNTNPGCQYGAQYRSDL